MPTMDALDANAKASEAAGILRCDLAMLKRAFGVKGAVFALYGITACFTALGLAMSLSRARVVYALALIVVCYVGVTAIKVSRRKYLESQATLAIDSAKRPKRSAS